MSLEWAPQRCVLECGLTVLVQPHASSGSVAVHLAVAAGAAFEPPQQAGLATLAARGLTRGTQSRSKQQIGETLDFCGADLTGTGGRHTAGLGGRCRCEDLETLMSLVADCAMHPTFPDEEVGKLVGDRLTALREQDDDPAAVCMRHLRQMLYPQEHPYARSTQGTRASVEKLSAADLRSFQQRHFAPDRALLVVVGGVDPEAVFALADSAFAGWEPAGAGGFRAARRVIPQVGAPARPERHVHPMPDKSQVDLAIGTVGIRRDDPRYYATTLGNTVLGRFAMGGRLGRQVREERGMAYYVYSILEAALGPGPWFVRAGVQPQHVDEAIECIRSELARVREHPPTEQELDDAICATVRSLPQVLESNEGTASLLLQIELYDLGLDYPLRFGDLIGGIQPGSVAQALRDLVDPDRFVVSIAGPYDASADS